MRACVALPAPTPSPRWKSVATVLLSVSLAGCAGLLPSGREGAATEMRTAPEAYQSNIDIGGRISVLYQQGGRDEALHGSFSWSQQSDHATVTLLSPLGQTLAVIDVTPDHARLTEAGQPPREAPDPDALALRVLGWPLPISGLRDWLQGVGQDARGKRFSASPAHPTITTADGWTLHYLTWEDVAPATGSPAPTSIAPNATPSPAPLSASPGAAALARVAVRPRRIDLERYTTEAGNVTIKLALDQWQPEASSESAGR